MMEATQQLSNMDTTKINEPVLSPPESETTAAESTKDVPDHTENESASFDEDDELAEGFADIDLSGIELSTDFIEEMQKSLDSKQTCDKLMDACSSTAQKLKETISEVLRTRENIVIATENSSIELESDLSQKITAFETVVTGSQGVSDAKTDLTNIKHPAFSNVIITEVSEADESNTAGTSTVEEITVDNTEEKKAITTQSEIVENPASLQVIAGKAEKATKNVDLKKELQESSKKTCQESSEAESIEKNTCNKNKPQQINSSSTREVEEDKITKKQPKSSGSAKRKGEKSVDQILKSLSNCSTTEEKLMTLCKRHLEVQEEYRLMEPRMKQLERQVQNQLREKEQLQTEYNRMILAKSRLESLCRELQRQNKAVKEESLSRIKEEEERRKEIASKFQVTLNEISTLMQDHSKKNLQLREENAELATKLKALVDHYDMWEKHIDKVVQQNHLEAQLAKAKYAKINLLLKQETEKFLREKQSMLENMNELQKKCTLLTANELKLRNELGDYTAKYEEFQVVLNKSSQVFSSFKNDMEATSKKIKKLEKETNVYKQKWESSNNALLGMINEKQKYDKELTNAQQRISTLEKLCRALQAERNELQNQLNAVTGSTHSNKNEVPTNPAQA